MINFPPSTAERNLSVNKSKRYDRKDYADDNYKPTHKKKDSESNSVKPHPKDRLKKRMFTVEEDNKIRQLVSSRGEKAWKLVASELSNRSPRQCRERWKNYLSPDVLNLPWTNEEDQKLTELINQFGAQWAKIARFFNARTDVNVKNRWSYLKRKEKKMGNSTNIEKQNTNKEDFPIEEVNIDANIKVKIEFNNEKYEDNFSSIEKADQQQICAPQPSSKFTNEQYSLSNKANEQLIEFWDSNWDSLDDNLSACI
ncbi:hypothetical protein M9Y10_020232 [Tritrichomonas musculus]|uniref:Myb-like DNA-binding domain containing protein n=1 Tax=Tritrichomonas musculus TaxID=1915356 RepID=A0ABR2HFN8_9EUKA